jgi:iron complex outermembrane recepter protein
MAFPDGFQGPHGFVRMGSCRQRWAGLCALALPGLVLGQVADPSAPPSSAGAALPRVTVSVPAVPGPEVGGFGHEPLGRTPLQAAVIEATQLRDRGLGRLADVTRIDASVADAYNAPGYWDSFTVRGFVLDNRSNFRRDGLPINAETSLPLDNKARIEVLKGLTGLQAGSAVPGGLVNLVVKRPLADALREAWLQVDHSGNLLAAVDVSDRFGAGRHLGWRLNVAGERLEPASRDASGSRGLLALAGDAHLGPAMRVEAEFEISHRSQPSVPGLSLLAGSSAGLPQVPPPSDPRLNLNNQPWSRPVVFGGQTGSLRITQALAGGWSARLHAAVQHLVTDDRLAFPFGCATENLFDRYCSDGRFDLYDYRSENERRRTAVIDASLGGRHRIAGLDAETTIGLQRSAYRQRLQRQAFNVVGQADIAGRSVLPADPTLTDENTQRDERSTEASLRHVLSLTEATRLWAGLRYTHLGRESVRTDGGRATAYRQSYTTPWLALSHTLNGSRLDGTLVYASWGEGVQSDVAPGRSRYVNAGQALPETPSWQMEVGFKGQGANASWGLAAFEIERPVFADIGLCDDTDGSCLRTLDGSARHVGAEARLGWQHGPWSLDAGLMALRARRQGSLDPSINGLPPVNVPAWSLKAEARRSIGAWAPGLQALLAVAGESSRSALPDNSVRIPGFARWDAALRWETTLGGAALATWRLGVDNLFDRRAWRESPFQFGHSYLYPLAPRTLRVSAQLALP